MPWVVGVDEAGYGPNLGPLVQAAVALHLPDDDPAGWETLRPVVRRAHEKKDERLLIDDSKKVYTRGGLKALERGVFAGVGLAAERLDEFVTSYLLAGCGPDLAAEHWYDRAEPVPLADWEWPGFGMVGGRCAVNLVPAPLFNKIVDGAESKAAVLSCGLVALLGAVRSRTAATPGPLAILCDKLGGRNYYAALVQQAFPDGWVVAERESADESRYRVERLGRPVTVVFRPRADAESESVALASMLAKYLREVCMRQFNRFWAKHVPGIVPTAGYPGDARRFYDQIRDAMARLGLCDDQVWRKR
jgi:ribonuclease HII